jgi:hypothetical protein
MYIDAVTKKTAASSYGEALTMRPLQSAVHKDLAGQIAEHFARY